MESKAVIAESAAESATNQLLDLTGLLTTHIETGLEAHADSIFLQGVPWLDNGGVVVTSNTFRFRTVTQAGALVLLDMPIYPAIGVVMSNLVIKPPPVGAPPTGLNPSQFSTVGTVSGTLTQTSLITEAEIEEFQDAINQLEAAIRAHVIAAIGNVHVPGGEEVAITTGTSYRNSDGVLLGNAIVVITFHPTPPAVVPTVLYIPARIVT